MNWFFLIVSVLALLCYLGITLWQCRGIRLNIKAEALCGLCAALTTALAFVYIPLPTGAWMYPGMAVPIMLLSLCADKRLAFISGFVTAILIVIVVPGWVPVHWAQFFIEYLPYFSCMGYAAFFGTDKKWKIMSGVGLSYLLLLTFRILSGILFFSQNAWAGYGSVSYSVLYNLSSCLPEAVISMIIMAVMPVEHIKKALHTGGNT